VALLWVLLVVNNSPWLPVSAGFDAPAHLDYARFILERGALPFADDGWQMFQPPLYYLLLAAGLAAGGVSPTGPDAAVVVRGLGLVIGLAHLALLGACMRLIFPQQPRRQIAGLLVGGFLPCMLYLHQYPANEPLVAMLSTAGILAALRLLRQDEPGWVGHGALGVVLGLALLAKVSALLLLPPILGALAVRALVGDRAWRTRRLAAAAVSVATGVATCGWYYVRVWQRFGTPFVGGWDARRGLGWWSDPGYRTLDDFLRFGRAFTAPLFAGFNGIWDGLYVTLWGDGLLSSGGGVALIPPWWSPALMSAALLLAAVPAAAVLAGAIAAFARWIRRPDATTGILVWLAFLVLLAILSMAVAVPTIAADKASYGLLALVPLCAFAGHALGVAAGGRWRRLVLASALGLWALASFATYWIDASSGKARLVKGAVEMQGGDQPGGLALIREANAKDPEDWSARVMLAGYLLQTGGARSEIERLLAPDEDVPGLAVRHVALAILAIQQGDTPRAETALRRAVALDPDNVQAHLELAALASAGGDPGGAVQELREVLRIDPQHLAAHVALTTLYGSLGDSRAAAMHQAYGARIRAER
jgi:tetratricopeptide (TPR) repeat protein